MWFVFVNTVRSIAFAILLNGGQMTRLIEEPLAVVMSLVAVLLGGVPAGGASACTTCHPRAGGHQLHPPSRVGPPNLKIHGCGFDASSTCHVACNSSTELLARGYGDGTWPRGHPLKMNGSDRQKENCLLKLDKENRKKKILYLIESNSHPFQPNLIS